MPAGRLRVAFACCLVLLAGCSAPASDGPDPYPFTDTTTTTTAGADTDAPDGVVVTGGSLSFDVNTTFERVQRLLDADFEGTRIVVRDLTSLKSANLDRIPFFDAFGVSDANLDTDEPAGLTTYTAVVYLSKADANTTRLRQVVAHEFVHVAQVREDMVPWFGRLQLTRVTLDKRLARRALVEGGAVYVTDAYTRRYLESARLQSARAAAKYAEGPAGNRVVWAQYHFGYRYVNATIDDPSTLPVVYETPPKTTENVLHPGGDRDDVAPLDVTVESASGAFDRVDSPTGRAGELVTRIVLRDAVGKRRAVRASEGWGNDRVVVFDGDRGESVAWVTRWDTERDASEFAAAARELDAAGYAYRVERVDARTVVVFAGSEAFVEAASASGNVTVTA